MRVVKSSGTASHKRIIDTVLRADYEGRALNFIGVFQVRKIRTLTISRWAIYLEHQQPVDGYVFDQLNGSITHRFERVSGVGFVGTLHQAIGIIGCLLASAEVSNGDQFDLVRVCSLIESLCISPWVDDAAFEPMEESSTAKPAGDPIDYTDDIPF